MMIRDRAIQALKQQIHHERIMSTDSVEKKIKEFDVMTEDVKLQNDNLRQLNEDLKLENETHFSRKIELDEKISELEQVKI